MKKIVVAIILIISLVIINNLVRSIFNLWQKQELVGKTEQELRREQVLNDNLKQQFSQVIKQDYIEKEARNKLFMVQPGEEVVFLPQDNKEQKKDTTQPRRKNKKSPMEEWLDIFGLQVGG